MLLLLVKSNSFAENGRVVIEIGGESYTRDYPEDYDSAITLIDYLAEMERTADRQVVKLTNDYNNSITEYEQRVSTLCSEIESLKDSLAEALASANETEKDVEKLTTVNSRFTAGLIIGPVFSYDKTFISGINTEILLEYRILRNFHIGTKLGLTALPTEIRPFEFNLGIVFGYSLY